MKQRNNAKKMEKSLGSSIDLDELTLYDDLREFFEDDPKYDRM